MRISRLALAVLGVCAASAGWSSPAFAAVNDWQSAWGGDIVQSGTAGDQGAVFEWCTTLAAPACQAARRSGLGGEFGTGGPAGAAYGYGRVLFVADPGANRIQVFLPVTESFDSTWGKDVVQSGMPGDAGAEAEVCTLAERCQAGTAGGRGGELNGPTAVGARVTGSDNAVYVADTGNHRIVKFTSAAAVGGAGQFISAWGKDVIQSGHAGDTGTGYEVCTVAADCKAGVAGTGLGGELTTPTGVTPDGAGHVFVTDAADLRVQRYDTSGGFQRAWGKDVIKSGATGDTGTGLEACAVAADCKAGASGTLGGELGGGGGLIRVAFGGASVFVSDANDNRVQRFDIDGAFQRAWGKGVGGGSAFGVCTVAASCQAGSAGGLGGEMTAPSAIAADGAAVFVTESAGRRAQKFDFNGTWSDAWGRGVKSGTIGYGHCVSAAGCLSGTAGALGGEFTQPLGLAAADDLPLQIVNYTNASQFIVADASNGRLDTFAGIGSTAATVSTSHHAYDLYFGTLTLKAPDGTSIRSVPAFASAIRVSQAAADAIGQALGADPRIAAGFAGHAPDGMPWITGVADPQWWETPNGPSAPIDEPSFDAQAAFTAQLAAQPQLAAGQQATCTDVPGVVRRLDESSADTWPSVIPAEGTFTEGPGFVTFGADHSIRGYVIFGFSLVDVDTSYPAITAHSLDRTCVVQPAPPATTAPSPSPSPLAPTPVVTKAPTFATVVVLPASKALRSCSSRRAFSIHLKAPSGDAITSAAVTVNGVTATKLTGKKVKSKIDLRGLPKGKFTVKITLQLRSGKTLKGSRSYKTCTRKQASRRT